MVGRLRWEVEDYAMLGEPGHVVTNDRKAVLPHEIRDFLDAEAAAEVVAHHFAPFSAGASGSVFAAASFWLAGVR